MAMYRAHKIYTPEWGKLDITEEEDGITMKLTDTRSDNSVSHKYWYYKDSMAMMMLKLDRIVHNMEDELEGRKPVFPCNE